MFIDSCHIKDKHVDILKNINAFKLKISLLHVNINLSFVKNNFLKKLVRSVALFYICTDVINVWLFIAGF